MHNLPEQIAKLSPEKRALLEKLLSKKQAGSAPSPAASPIEPAARDAEHYPLSSAEQRLWFLDRFSATGAAFNLHAAIDLDGPLDRGALAASFDRLIARHEILRTRYVTVDGEPRRAVDAGSTFRCETVDLSDLDDAAAHAQIERLAHEHAHQTFALDRGPLFAATLVVRDERRHVLLLAMHHIVSDAWSLTLMLDEIWSGYDAVQRGEPAAAPLAAQYLDYALWQQRELASPRLARQIDYWRAQLDGAPDLFELPADRPRPAVQSYAGGELRFRIPLAAWNALKDTARGANASAFMASLAAFVALLARFSGQSDIVVGTDVAGRNHAETEPLIGFFVNQLALRCRCDTGASALALLRDVRRVCLDAYANQDVPFNHLVDQLRIARDPSRTPLFQVKFMLQNTPDAAADDSDLRAHLRERDEDTSQFDVLLALKEGRDDVYASLRYRSDLFDAATAQRLADYYHHYIDAFARAPDAPLRALAWTPDAERAQIAALNDTTRPLAFVALPDAFAARARERADKTAVRCAADALTYAELHARVDTLAAHLLACGVGPEQPVAVCLPRGIDMLVALLAVLRAGACYVPLDPEYGAERVGYVLADCGARVAICAADAHNLPDTIARVALDAQWHERLAATPPAAWPHIDGEQLAYVIYTSGSTGRPKGVAVRHYALANFLDTLGDLTAFADTDTLLAVTTVAFDIAALELYLPLVAGASLVVATREEAQDARLLFARLRDASISVLQATPSTWRGLLIASGGAPLGVKALCGGEALPQELAAQLLDACTSLVNVYGPTETTIWSSFAPLAAAHVRDLANAPLGRPIANTTLHVLDAYGNPQPLGVPGELYIGGDGLARGYWNRAELTAAAFVPDPFSTSAGARMYRTGDLVRRLPDGRLVYLGRGDQQVKVRGHRIELGEIESVLATHDDVAHAVVVTRPDTVGSALLVAFVQPEDREPAVEDLLQHAARFLPRYMLPNEVRYLDAMPLTPNGKVDRKALAQAARDSGPAPEAAGTLPVRPLEVRVAAVWSEVLGVADVFLEQDFFRAGGHSLLAVQLLDRIEREFGVELPLPRFFQAPTVAGVVQQLDAGLVERVEYPTIVADPAARHEPFPLTGIQQAYWLGRSGSFELGNIATQNYLEIDIADLDPARLAAAWNRLVRRHDMLRAVFDADGTQRIRADMPDFEPPIFDLRALAPDAADAFLADLRARMKSRVLPADTGPLFDIAFTRRDESRWRMHYCIDMLISDVVSNHILFDELGRLYADPDAALAPLTVTFRDYVLAETALHETPRYARARQYWLDRVADFPGRPELPLARDPAQITQPRFSRRRYELDAPLWRALRERARDLRVSPTALVLAVFGETLGTWSKSPRFALNLTLFNRLPLHADVDGLIGDFTSSLLLELAYAPTRPFVDRLADLQARLWQDLEHKLFGGVDMIREIARSRGGAHGASMPVVFTSVLGLADGDAPAEAESRAGEEGYSASQTSQVWLDHQVAERDGALCLVWDALDDVFPDGMLDAMFEAYAERLVALAQDPAAWLRTSCLTPPAQIAHRAEINHVPAPIGPERLHDLVAAGAARHPDAVAIRCGDVAIGHAQLQRMSDALAARIVAAGATRGELVAIVMRKGWQQVVAALAIVKTGAAYMPVDADLPEQRRRQVIAEGQARIALTQSDLADALAGDGVALLVVDDALLDTPSAPPVDLAGPADDIAYVIFTSGSTGKPKGVVIDHRGAVNTVLDINRRFGVTAGDSVLALSSLSFDLSVWDIFGVLAAGGAIVVPTPAQMHSAAEWWTLVRDHGITIWNTVPALMQLLVEHNEPLATPTLAPLRVVMMSGDWIPVSLPDRIRALAPTIDVISLGGATEASIWSIFHPITEPTVGLRSIPYGKPLSNQTMHVLDDALQPRPEWVPGALYIGGIGLAKGYWNDPVKTAASFIRGPDGAMLYRTGDLGRYLADGNIEFLGREDSQVKVQGYRIELGDIEAALQSHPAIGAAAVTAIGANQDSKTLVAYVVPRANAADDGGDVEIADHHARSAFKLEQRGVRRCNAALARVALAGAGTRIAALLDGLQSQPVDGRPLPKYRYPSAASLYPVQAYVHLDDDAAADWGAPSGFYYYAPHEHALVHLAAHDALGDGTSGVYWVADLDAIRPLYPADQAERFCVLEAGYASAVVAQNAHALGAAPAFEWRVRPHGDDALLPSNALVLGRLDLHATAARTGDADVAEPVPAHALHLPPGRVSRALDADAIARQSYRRYADRACDLQQIADTLALIAPTPGCEYWLYARPGRCDGIDAGWHRYLPGTHALVAATTDADPAALYNDDNAAIFADAAFAIAIATSNDTGDAALLAQTGANGQTLMSGSWRSGIGLCPIGHLRAAPLARALDRPDGWRVLHGFVGGAIDAAQTRTWNPDDASAAASLDRASLAAWLAERLPAYMVPRVFVGLAALPLSSNGKVDRKALPKPDLDAEADTAYAEPAGATQQLVAALWARLLKLERVGARDNFFALGGNSLVAMQFAARLRIEHGIDLGLRQIFEQPTVAQIAALLNARQTAATGSDIAALRSQWRHPADGDGVAHYPLSLAQRHLFAHQQREDDASAYNIPAALRLDGPIDVDAMRAAVQAVVDRHEALRTRFVYVDGEIWQRVDATLAAPFDVVDLAAHGDDSEAAAQTLLQDDAVRPFDLFEGPLLRARLLRLAPQRHVLVLNVHHIVADYLSMDILVQEMNAVYAAAGDATNLPALPLHYPDFVLWERDFLAGDDATRQRAYWHERLDGVPPLALPPVAAGADGWHSFRIDGELVERLRARGRQTDLTMFMLGFAATHRLLASQCGQDDFALGTPISTRRVGDLEGCIGLLLNTLPIRVAASDADSGLDFLRETRLRCMQAFEHKDYPYEALLSQRRRSDGGRDEAPYRVRYVYRRIAADAEAARRQAEREIDIRRRQAKFDLLVTINEADDHLFGEFEYRGTALSADAAALLAQQLPLVLAWLADAPQQPLAELAAQLDAHRHAAQAQRRERRNNRLGDALKSLRR